MSIQFRSRIRSVFDYGKELKKIGKCCFTDNTSSSLTFLECFKAGGQFFSDSNFPCPQASDIGYCCACSYTDEGFRSLMFQSLPYDPDVNALQQVYRSAPGIRPNITKCECDRIGGKWTANIDLDNYVSVFYACQKQISYNGNFFFTDARIPSACCSLVIENNTPVGVTCEHVCNNIECANKVLTQGNQSPDPFADSVYNPNQLCQFSTVAGIPPAVCNNNITTSKMLTSTSAFSDTNHGACYELTLNNDVYSYNCSLTPKFKCTDYWIDPELTNEEVVYCEHKYKPKTPTKTSGYLNPIVYTETEFNSLNLTVGQEFQGGIYIGTFQPLKSKTSNSSQVFGALNFSTPQSIRVPVSDESKYKKWAIIVNKNYIETPLITDGDFNSIYESSYYDGYLNCYGEPQKYTSINSKTILSITGIIRNGFADYYIPSIVEMMFFAEQLKSNKIISDIFNLNKIFTSTTFFTDKYSSKNPTGQNTFDGNHFLYSMSFQTGKNYGKSTIVGINSIVNLMLFRRLIIS